MVSKRAKLSVVAFSLTVQIGGTELGLVLVRMVKLLNSVVRFVAVVLVWALLMLVYVLALLRLVEP